MGNSGADFDQSAKGGLLGDDLGVKASICRGWNDRGERVQVVCTARLNDFAVLHQLVGDGNDVCRFALAKQGENCLEDQFVLGGIEVAGADLLEYLGDGLL